MKRVTELDREEITTLLAAWAVMGLLAHGHTLDSARSYLASRRWPLADGPVDLLVRDVVAVIADLLGGEADAEAFLLRGAFWSVLRDPAVEALLRVGASPEAARRLIEDWTRDQAAAESGASSRLVHSLLLLAIRAARQRGGGPRTRPRKNRVIDRGRTPIGKRPLFPNPPDPLRALLGSVSPMGFFATKPELVELALGSASDRPAREGSP